MTIKAATKISFKPAKGLKDNLTVDGRDQGDSNDGRIHGR